MTNTLKRHRRGLLGSSLALALAAPVPAIAQAQTFQFNIPAQPLDGALRALARTSRQQILFDRSLVRGRTAPALIGSFSVDEGLRRLLSESGLTATRGTRGAYVVSLGSGETEAGGAAADSGSAEEQEIVVTAQKRPERLIDIPQSVSVLRTDDLDRLNAVRFRDFANTIPGLTYTTSGAGATSVSLRGVTAGADVSPTVAIYVDEVPYGSSTSYAAAVGLAFDMALSDIDRIEVLRGPQGTLYGASSMGGLIKYVTREPDMTEFSGLLRAGASTTRHGGIGYNGSLAFNIPAADGVALRVSGFQNHDGGFVDNPRRGERNVDRSDTYGGRIDLLLQPTDRLKVRLTGFTQDIHRDGRSNVEYTLAGVPVIDSVTQNRVTPEPFDQTYRLVSATINLDVDWARLTSVTSYQEVRSRVSSDLTPLYLAILRNFGRNSYSGIVQNAVNSTDRFTQEVRLDTGRVGAFEFLLGGFYTNERSVSRAVVQPFDLAGAPATADIFNNERPSEYEEYAAFGSGTVHLNDRFDVSLGFRAAHNRIDTSTAASGILAGGSSQPNIESSETVVTYLANARYRITDRATAYFRYATGYRPGGPNLTSIDPTTGNPTGPASYASDSLASYEVGLHAESADRKFGIDVAAYHVDWDNIQVSVFRSNGFGGFVNAPGATVDGLELSMFARPVPNLTFSAAVAHQDAELSEDSPTELRATRGERLPNVPRYTVALNGDYTFGLGNLEPRFGATVRHVSKRNTGFSGIPTSNYRLPDYTTLDLRAGIRLGEIDLQAFIRNVTDVRGQLSALTGIGSPRIALLQPRTFGLSLRTAF